MPRPTKSSDTEPKTSQPKAEDAVDLGAFTRTTERPRVLGMFLEMLALEVDVASKLLEELNERSESWMVLKTSCGSQWNSTTREVTLTVGHVYPELRFTSALGESSHLYAITDASKLDFEPATGQVISAEVRRAFVVRAVLLKPDQVHTQPAFPPVAA